MKILRYLLVTVLILGILFFGMGVLRPSVSYGHQITVDKPVKEAWAVAKDESKYGQWLEGFQSIELIEGEQGKAGSKYKVVVLPGEDQSEFEMTQTLVSVDEFKQVDLHFDSEFMDFEQTYTYTPSNGQTTIKTDSKVIGKSMVTRSMFAIMETLGGSFTAQERKNMEALKRVIEANTTDYYPEPTLSEMDAELLARPEGEE